MSKFLIGLLVLFVLVLIATPWVVILALPLLLIASLVLSPVAFVLWNIYLSVRTTKPWRVLVADDDKISIAPLLSALTRRSVEVLFVQSGQDVLNALKKQDFDLMFLDMMMPGLNGESVLRIGEEMLDAKHMTPVIFYTGHQESVQGLLNEKFNVFKVNGVWGKNMTFATLDQRLDQVLISA